MDCLALNVRAWFVTKSSTGAFELGGVRKLVMDGGGEMSRGIYIYIFLAKPRARASDQAQAFRRRQKAVFCDGQKSLFKREKRK